MSIPEIVLEDLYRRIRELEEAVRKLEKGQTVYEPVRPLPPMTPTFPSLPLMPYPTPVWSGGVQPCETGTWNNDGPVDCMYERAAKSGEPFAGICNCPKHRLRLGPIGGKVPPTPPSTEYAKRG